MKAARGYALGLLLLLSLLLAPPARGWSFRQHAVIAEVAEHYLLPETREDIRYLLGPVQRMADDSGWADTIRGRRPWTAPWHYLSWPLELEEPDFDVFSTERGNVVSAIEEQLAVYRDRSRSRRTRREALKFVIHLVGDLHQPLHVGTAEDRGGNQVPVLYRGHPTNLHTAWDGAIYDNGGDSPEDHAAGLREGLEEEERDRIMSGEPYDWALESHRIVREFVYPRLEDLAVREDEMGPPELSGPYAEAARPIMRRRMLEAGLRLAYLLNRPGEEEAAPEEPEESPTPPPEAEQKFTGKIPAPGETPEPGPG